MRRRLALERLWNFCNVLGYTLHLGEPSTTCEGGSYPSVCRVPRLGERERQEDREGETERERERQREKETEREGERERETQRVGETQRETEREGETQREREGETQREE